MDKYALESFIDFCDDMMITNEADLQYKIMRKMQTNSLALHNQLMMQKKDLNKKYKECEGAIDELENLIKIIKKRREGIIRKINGNEVKNKKALQKFVDLYDNWIDKLNKEIKNNA